MKISGINEPTAYVLSLPLRVLVGIPFCLYLLLVGKIRVGRTSATSFKSNATTWLLTLPLRVVIGPPVVLLLFLVGEIKINES